MGTWRVHRRSGETSPLNIGSRVEIDNTGDPPEVWFDGRNQANATYIGGNRSLIFARGHTMRIVSDDELLGSKGRSDEVEGQAVGTWAAEGQTPPIPPRS